MRKTCLDEIYKLAQKDERVIFIGSDLGVGTLETMREELPERFIMAGISEAAVVGMAAGMAMEGKIVYVNTIAVFLTRRSYEQVAIDLCLHNANVRLVGNGGGFVYAPLGPTHQAIDDIAIMRALPNMTIVAPADADEMKRLMQKTLDHEGPVYIRLGKGYDPIVSSDAHNFEIGAAITMRQGDDALIVTTGVTLKVALDAAKTLGQQGIEVAILHMHTIKPLDTKSLIDQATEKKTVITIEEHSIIGGLGSAVAETLLESGLAPKTFKRFGVPDEFAENYGSQSDLMRHYGLDAESILTFIIATAL